MAHIFLSYAREDRAKAAAVADALAVRGWTVWWDRTIPPGRTFDEVIEEALDQALCVLVLWSQTSVGSHWVKAEAAEGARRQILVPALLDRVKIPLEFRRLQAADLTTWHGDLADPEFEKLVNAIPTLEPRSLVDAADPLRDRLSFSAPEPFDAFKPATFPGSAVNGASQSRPVWMGWLVGLAVLAILSIGFSWWHWRQGAPRAVVVPNVVGQGVDQARAALTRVGLAIGRIDGRPTDNVPPNQVLEQRPVAAASIAPPETVNLVISTVAQVVVPSVAGMPLDEANAQLRRAGLTLGTTSVRETDDSSSAGSVIAQRPARDERVGRGTSVDVVLARLRTHDATVSSGIPNRRAPASAPTDVEVPSVTGLGLAEARTRLEQRGFKVGQTTSRRTGTVPPKTVVDQQPRIGSKQPPGTSISLVIAQPANIAVPALVGLRLDAAQAALAAARLQTGNVTKSLEETATANVVVSSEPRAGTELEEGHRVDLVIAQPAAKVPQLVGLTSIEAADALTRARLVPGKKTSVASFSRPGIVLSQRVPVGTLLTPGSPIDFEVTSSSNTAATSRGPRAAPGNAITNIRVIDRSRSELVIEANVFYDGAGGADRIMPTAFVMNGSERAKTFRVGPVVPLNLNPGDNRITLPVTFMQAEGPITTTALAVCIVRRGAARGQPSDELHCQTIPREKTWSPRVNTVTSFRPRSPSPIELEADVVFVYDGAFGTSGIGLVGCAVANGNKVPGMRCDRASLQVGENRLTLKMGMTREVQSTETTHVEICVIGAKDPQCQVFTYQKRWSWPQP